jgi:hypothetical protein
MMIELNHRLKERTEQVICVVSELGSFIIAKAIIRLTSIGYTNNN